MAQSDRITTMLAQLGLPITVVEDDEHKDIAAPEADSIILVQSGVMPYQIAKGIDDATLLATLKAQLSTLAATITAALA